jgi:hypothetical protein
MRNNSMLHANILPVQSQDRIPKSIYILTWQTNKRDFHKDQKLQVKGGGILYISCTDWIHLVPPFWRSVFYDPRVGPSPLIHTNQGISTHFQRYQTVGSHLFVESVGTFQLCGTPWKCVSEHDRCVKTVHLSSKRDGEGSNIVVLSYVHKERINVSCESCHSGLKK